MFLKEVGKSGIYLNRLRIECYYLQINPLYQGVHALPSHTALLHKGRVGKQEKEWKCAQLFVKSATDLTTSVIA